MQLHADCSCNAGKAVQHLYVCVMPCNECRDAEGNSNSSKAEWAMQKEIMLKYVQVCNLCLSIRAFVNICLHTSMHVCVAKLCVHKSVCILAVELRI